MARSRISAVVGGKKTNRVKVVRGPQLPLLDVVSGPLPLADPRPTAVLASNRAVRGQRTISICISMQPEELAAIDRRAAEMGFSNRSKYLVMCGMGLMGKDHK